MADNGTDPIEGADGKPPQAGDDGGNAAVPAGTPGKPPDGAPHGVDWKSESRKWERQSKANLAALGEAEERAKKAEERLAALEAERERSSWNGSVSKETGVPEDVLASIAADSEESLKEKAERIKGYFEKPSAPYVGSEGKSAGPIDPPESPNDWLRSTLKR